MTGTSGSYLSDEQVAVLLKPIHPKRVSRHPHTGMSHVEGYDIRAELNRVFGFGRWDAEVTDQVLLREVQTKTSKGGDAWNVVYRTRVRLTVRTPDGAPLSVQEATHIGESTVPAYGDAHGNAVTNSETYALRRCCINFGDQFGLSLYNKGSQQPVVRWTLVRPEAGQVDTDDVPEVNAEQQEESGQRTEPPAADLDAWKAKAGAASGRELQVLKGDLERMRSGDEIGTEDAARVASVIAHREAELDRAGRQPETGGTASSKAEAALKTRIAEAAPDEFPRVKVEIAKAVQKKDITPETANGLVALLRERAAELEGENVDHAA